MSNLSARAVSCHFVYFFLIQHHVSFALGGHYNAAFWIVQFYGIVATGYIETVELGPGGFTL